VPLVISLQRMMSIAVSSEEVRHHYSNAKGIKVVLGTMVDATIMSAPSSTRNADMERGHDLHQTRKDNLKFSHLNTSGVMTMPVIKSGGIYFSFEEKKGAASL